MLWSGSFDVWSSCKMLALRPSWESSVVQTFQTLWRPVPIDYASLSAQTAQLADKASCSTGRPSHRPASRCLRSMSLMRQVSCMKGQSARWWHSNMHTLMTWMRTLWSASYFPDLMCQTKVIFALAKLQFFNFKVKSEFRIMVRNWCTWCKCTTLWFENFLRGRRTVTKEYVSRRRRQEWKLTLRSGIWVKLPLPRL